MPNTTIILNACLPVFLVIGAGYVVRRMRLLTAEADESLLRVVLNLLFPAFVIDHLLGSTGGGQSGTILLAIALGAGFVLIGIGVAYAAGGLVGMRDGRRRTFGLAVGLQNYGFIPIPILLSLFDGKVIAVHLLHTVGVEVAIWTAGVMLLTGGRGGAWRHLLNAPLITTLVCLVANALFESPALPAVAAGAASMLSACAVPFSLLLVGATIHDLLRAADPDADRGRPVPEAIAAIAVRLLALPALILLGARFIPMPVELQQVLVVQAAMPCAVFPIILARRYRGDSATAVRVVLATTCVSVLSIPQVIAFGLWWSGASP